MSGENYYDTHEWEHQPDGTYVCRVCGVSNLENPCPPCQQPLFDDEDEGIMVGSGESGKSPTLLLLSKDLSEGIKDVPL